jgi:hypothetical protein
VALVPPAVVTVTLTVPLPDGDVAVMEVELLTVKLAVFPEPKSTALAPVRFVPVTVTDVPPAKGPADGLTEVTVGTKVYRNWSAALVALVPPAVVTVTLTVPLPDGEVAVMELELLTVKVAAAVFPNLTALVPVKPVPVTVTEVPPPDGPEEGLTELTVGAAT